MRRSTEAARASSTAFCVSVEARLRLSAAASRAICAASMISEERALETSGMVISTAQTVSVACMWRASMTALAIMISEVASG
ncbi:hypothetical protein [Rhizobium sp. NLR17b]|uniref:hypothetical protein n=1 Tax=Rhizobium sp. NLR17b TaxID=2731114 RepID=UPI002180BE3D|nr:hypothetical protein [Rhizobium sp. NLR17b]